MKKALVLVGMFFVSVSSVFSAEQSDREVYGVYKTSGPSHYLNGEIALEPWGNSLLMRSTLVDNGRQYAVQATLDRSGPNSFRGAGKILVRYTPNTGCNHRFGISITLVDGKVYVRENTPPHIPYDPYGPCVGAGPYEWYNHPQPYVQD